ncbi:MAG: CRTAC1 family protein [Deltaproteobacteria bacterium]|nr:CRTAC1 family protein [Deltaproteobacteria bacterium]
MAGTQRASFRSGGTAAALAVIGLAIAVAFATPAFAESPTPPQFTDVAEAAGIRFKHNFGADKLENVLMTTGSGAALCDFDNDGWLDAFLVNGTFFDADGKPRADKFTTHALYRNLKNGKFEDVTKAAGLAQPSYGQGVTCTDFDGDGFVDLFITNYGPNRLYRNRGNLAFEDVTDRAGVGGGDRWHAGAAFFDYDGDGDLDLYVSTYVKFKPAMSGVHASSLSQKTGFRFFPGPRDYQAEAHSLYRNNGNGTFADVTKEAGAAAEGGKGLNVVASDFDNDGDQDVFVANDASPNFLFRNDGGKFTEVGTEAGVAYDPDGVETAAMGVDVADVNGDGLQDLYVTNMIFEFNNLYQNKGRMSFEDTTRTLGLDQDNYRHVGWATRFEDFNHDGNLDCFVANGHVVDYVEGFSQSITYPQQRMLFLGNADGRFKNMIDECGEVMRRKRVGRGGAFADFDNDGDIDILMSNSGQHAELLRNDLPRNDRWLKIRLKGKAPNTDAIGAKVAIRLGDRTLNTEVRYTPAYLSSSDPTIHVGLKPGINEANVDVIWPSKQRSVHTARAATLTVIEESAEPKAEEKVRPAAQKAAGAPAPAAKVSQPPKPAKAQKAKPAKKVRKRK